MNAKCTNFCSFSGRLEPATPACKAVLLSIPPPRCAKFESIFIFYEKFFGQKHKTQDSEISASSEPIALPLFFKTRVNMPIASEILKIKSPSDVVLE